MRILLPAMGIAAILFSGGVHGVWTGRWQVSEEPGVSAARLAQVALELGDWQGQAVETAAQQSPEIAGCLQRRYVNRLSGSTVTVFLVCGRPGPVSIHPPDACYRASGYQVRSPQKFVAAIDALTPTPEFRVAHMLKTKAAEQTQLRVFWSWSATGTWQVPQDPRLTFARYPALFKLYLIRDVSSAGEPLEGDPCVDLMRQLLPELQRSLFAQV